MAMTRRLAALETIWKPTPEPDFVAQAARLDADEQGELMRLWSLMTWGEDGEPNGSALSAEEQFALYQLLTKLERE